MSTADRAREPKATVLVVEDNEDTRALLLTLLEMEGYRVVPVGSGEEALTRLGRDPGVDLIILDLMLPGISGYEVVESLRAHEETDPIPVLLLSARSGPADRIRGLRDGADGYLTKPFLPEEVATSVRTLVTGHLLARRNREFQALERIAHMALSATNEQELVERIISQLQQTFRADVAAIFLADPDQGQLRAQALAGVQGEAPLRVPADQGVVGSVFSRGEPEFVMDAAEDPRLKDPPPHEAGLRSVMAAPLISEGNTVGVLEIGTTGHALDARALRLLMLLADRVAVAIGYARLKAETRELADVTRSVGEGVLVLDADDRVTFANPAFAEMVGRDASALRGHVWTEFLAPAQDVSALTLRLRQPSFQGELLLMRAGGDPLPALATVTHHPSPQGPRRIGVFRNISHEHEQRFQVIREQKLRTLGSLAAGVAHNINNRLTPVLGWTDLLLERLDRGQAPDPDELRNTLQIIRQGASDSVATVRRLQDYARPQSMRGPEVVALKDVVEQLLALTRPQWDNDAARRGIHYDIRVQEEREQCVLVVPSELREALLNVLENALHAMPGGGTLTIAIGGDAERATLRVSDTGVGMSDEVRRVAFEPFFTTRQDAGGTGLGLTLAQEIVRRHDGRVTLASTPGGGTTVTFHLPAARGEQPAPQKHQNGVQPRRILVVEDEPAVLGVIRAMLSNMGHSVVTASNGLQALQTLDRERVDLVITDHGMPGMTGLAVAKEIQQRRPGTPVVLATGWGTDIREEEMAAAQVKFAIPKPFTREALRVAVVRATGG